jgi:segregation and condensation protein A
VVARLRELGAASFRELVADAAERLVVVARFLALLELFRERAVTFEQLTPLGELRVRWVAGDADAIEISAEFDTETDPQERSDDRTG